MASRLYLNEGDTYQGYAKLCHACDQKDGTAVFGYGDERITGVVADYVARFEFTAGTAGEYPFTIEGVTLNGEPINGVVEVAPRALA